MSIIVAAGESCRSCKSPVANYLAWKTQTSFPAVFSRDNKEDIRFVTHCFFVLTILEGLDSYKRLFASMLLKQSRQWKGMKRGGQDRDRIGGQWVSTPPFHTSPISSCHPSNEYQLNCSVDLRSLDVNVICVTVADGGAQTNERRA